ncbi:MAG: hypothetical protein Q9227_008549 [Pyrenula ochraceoflavens]
MRIFSRLSGCLLDARPFPYSTLSSSRLDVAQSFALLHLNFKNTQLAFRLQFWKCSTSTPLCACFSSSSISSISVAELVSQTNPKSKDHPIERSKARFAKRKGGGFKRVTGFLKDVLKKNVSIEENPKKSLTSLAKAENKNAQKIDNSSQLVDWPSFQLSYHVVGNLVDEKQLSDCFYEAVREGESPRAENDAPDFSFAYKDLEEKAITVERWRLGLKIYEIALPLFGSHASNRGEGYVEVLDRIARETRGDEATILLFNANIPSHCRQLFYERLKQQYPRLHRLHDWIRGNLEDLLKGNLVYGDVWEHPVYMRVQRNQTFHDTISQSLIPGRPYLNVSLKDLGKPIRELKKKERHRSSLSGRSSISDLPNQVSSNNVREPETSESGVSSAFRKEGSSKVQTSPNTVALESSTLLSPGATASAKIEVEDPPRSVKINDIANYRTLEHTATPQSGESDLSPPSLPNISAQIPKPATTVPSQEANSVQKSSTIAADVTQDKVQKATLSDSEQMAAAIDWDWSSFSQDPSRTDAWSIQSNNSREAIDRDSEDEPTNVKAIASESLPPSNKPETPSSSAVPFDAATEQPQEPPEPSNLADASTFFTTHRIFEFWSGSEWRQGWGTKSQHDPADTVPEVAFIGRSNVGKSSLLNAVLGKQTVFARTSNRPGLTQTMHAYGLSKAIYEIKRVKTRKDGGAQQQTKKKGGKKNNDQTKNDSGKDDSTPSAKPIFLGRGPGGDNVIKLAIVDMPGYGHGSNVAQGENIMSYLKQRKQLKRIFLLIDPVAGVKKKDLDTIRLVESMNLPFQIVVTKGDLLRKRDPTDPSSDPTSKLEKAIERVRTELGLDGRMGRSVVITPVQSLDFESYRKGRSVGVERVQAEILRAVRAPEEGGEREAEEEEEEKGKG